MILVPAAHMKVWQAVTGLYKHWLRRTEKQYLTLSQPEAKTHK